MIAIDKKGLKTTKEFKVTVKEKKVEVPVASSRHLLYSSPCANTLIEFYLTLIYLDGISIIKS